MTRKYSYAKINLGVPSTIVQKYTYDTTGATIADCAGLQDRIYTLIPKAFMEETITSTTVFGMYNRVSESNGQDWIPINDFRGIRQATVVAGADKTCSIHTGNIYTFHYSYSISPTNQSTYIQGVVQEPIYTSISYSTPAAGQTFEIRHSFTFQYHEPSIPSAIAAKTQGSFAKYGGGILGAINYFFSELLLPLILPSSAQVN